MDREQAKKVLEKYIQKPNLVKHSLAVEAAMKYFATMNNEDAEYWGNVGLLHDVDYELHPDEHCKKSREILEKEGFDDDFIKAVQSHGYELCTDVKPEKFMEKALITVDQLTGFIIACAMVQPNKKLDDVTLESMLKKWKKKDFAAGTNRERIEHWASEMGYSLEDTMVHTLSALRTIGYELGL